MEKRLLKLWAEFKAVLNSDSAWLAAFGEVCLAAIEHALEADLPVVAATEFFVCSVKLLAEYAFLNQNKAVKQLVNEFQAVLHRDKGGRPMAAFPNIPTPPTCVTGKGTHKGICCQAVTQLGAAQAATGFTYTSCSGKTVCLKCGIGTSQSTNPARRNKPIFIPRRVSCGPSGCPALATQ